MFATAQGTPGTPQSLGRIIGPENDTVVTRIDQQTREITLALDSAITHTVYLPEQVVKDLTELKVGDRVLGTYSASVEGDIREPTNEDMLTPWQVLEEGVLSERDGVLQVEHPRIIQAVVTVGGIDRSSGVLIVWDYRRFPHFIAHVEAEKLADLSVDQRVVVVFSQAMATTFRMPR
mgnify:FL=1